MSSSSTAISGNSNTNESEWQSSWPPHAVEMARLALQLTSQEWSLTGADSDCCETTATSTSTTHYDGKDEEITKRMVALLFIRMVALVTCNLGNVYPTSFNNINNGSFNISFNSDRLVEQRRRFTKITAPLRFAKLCFVRLININTVPASTSATHRPTYGVKSSPLTQLAFLFSALVHDVDHTGISNRQLVLESDDLAILYNDQSVAEQRSLAVAFSTLKGVGYRELRGVLFSGPRGGDIDTDDGVGGQEQQQQNQGGEEDQFKFRKLVIDLVLVTDIASPERTQIVKSKWKEAFGEVQFAEKLKRE
eukprot:g9074.t1 g9074   contig34:785508-786745(+)